MNAMSQCWTDYFNYFNYASAMILKERIDALVQLGQLLKATTAHNDAVFQKAQKNAWFTPENIRKAVDAVSNQMLSREAITNVVEFYHLSEPAEVKTVAVIMAGNIPLVGFHDFFCVFICGQKAIVKLSEKDDVLFPYILELLLAINPKVANYVSISERLAGFDAVIATGSNNTARYFEQYFGKYPNIIRKNRHSVAILTGTETDEDILQLGEDIFAYFGLGCRNVSKLYLPQGYELAKLMEPLHDYKELVMHNKYKNNFDYNMALMLLNRLTFFNNGCLILLEDKALASRISTVHVEYYTDLEAVKNDLVAQESQLQCVVSGFEIPSIKTIAFGQTQQPTLFDYPDNVDVIQFVLML
jgi:hypothetical protein